MTLLEKYTGKKGLTSRHPHYSVLNFLWMFLPSGRPPLCLQGSNQSGRLIPFTSKSTENLFLPPCCCCYGDGNIRGKISFLSAASYLPNGRGNGVLIRPERGYAIIVLFIPVCRKIWFRTPERLTLLCNNCFSPYAITIILRRRSYSSLGRSGSPQREGGRVGSRARNTLQ